MRWPSLLLLIAVLAGGGATRGAEAVLADGKQLYERRCGVCHLPGQTGTNMLERRLGRERALLAERIDLTPEYISRVVRWDW